MNWYIAVMEIGHSLKIKQLISISCNYFLNHIKIVTLTTSCIKDILKFQSNWIASFSRTSFREPFGQYSDKIKTVGQGKSIQAPTNLTVFSWFTSLACLISHSNVEFISTFWKLWKLLLLCCDLFSKSFLVLRIYGEIVSCSS